jgi:hypothetical protein
MGQLSLPQFKNWHLSSLHWKVESVAIWGNYKNTAKHGYDIGLYDTLSTTSNILWYKLISHC